MASLFAGLLWLLTENVVTDGRTHLQLLTLAVHAGWMNNIIHRKQAVHTCFPYLLIKFNIKGAKYKELAHSFE
jgi:hypothetical protein